MSKVPPRCVRVWVEDVEALRQRPEGVWICY